MKRLVFALSLCLILAVVLILDGCAGCEQTVSHMKSSAVGLNRVITLYDCSGNVIKTWNIKGTVEDQGGSFRFLYEGKAITISGTVVIEEVSK